AGPPVCQGCGAMRASAHTGRSGRQCRDNDESLRLRPVIRDGEVDLRRHAGRSNRGEPDGRTAGQKHGRLARRQVHDTEIAPEHAGREAGAERLGAGLLGRETLGVTRGTVGPAVRLGALDIGEDALDEARTEPLKRTLDTPDIDDVLTDTENHERERVASQALRSPPASARDLSISARMRRMALSSPEKIASPTRKWPIFSSTIVGIAAIGPTVSKVRPWPAWHSRPIASACAAAATMRSRWCARSRPSASQ